MKVGDVASLTAVCVSVQAKGMSGRLKLRKSKRKEGEWVFNSSVA